MDLLVAVSTWSALSFGLLEHPNEEREVIRAPRAHYFGISPMIFLISEAE